MVGKDKGYSLEEQALMREEVQGRLEEKLREKLQNLEVGDVIISKKRTTRKVIAIDNVYFHFLIKRVGQPEDNIKTNKAEFIAMPLGPVLSITKASNK